MATTSLWHIEGRLKDLIAYVENPEKTVANNSALQPLWEVMSYVSRPEATEQGKYVSTINCLKEIALQQMILTKKQYGKEDGYIAWHGYQSFKPDEVTAKEAHEIGMQTAREMWGDRYQIIVTTHLDKDHLHNHFCFNSVSFIDGGKYDYSKKERWRLMQVSDRICVEHGLSVIKNPNKAPSRQVWLDEKSGKPTRYNVYREDMREAIDYSRSPKYIEEYLQRKGYITDFTGKHWKIRLPQYEHFTRLDTLDERWTPENLKWSVGRYVSFGSRRAYISYPKDMPQDVKDWFQPFHRTSHIYRLYLHYCYLLGYLPKNTDYKPTSPYLKEDLKKLDEISEQVRYMGKYHIETFDDLYADRAKIENDMDMQKKRSDLNRSLRDEKRELEQAQTRIRKLDEIIRQLYEDKIEGKISDERFSKLTDGYELEQKTLESRSGEIRSHIASENEATVNVNYFLSLVRKYSDVHSLSGEIVREFVEKIYVSQAETIDGERCQKIRIVWNCIGEFTPPLISEKEVSA